MPYKQVKSFNIANMGKKSGWCLQNCRLGFGISTGKYASAKADMEAQRKAGTLHPINTLPTNVAVPVYLDTSSKYEHIVVSDKGTIYSDGKCVSNLYSLGTPFGWGESCDGVRVVEFYQESSFLPARGYWKLGDNDTRIAKLAQFMYDTFRSYTSKNALGSYYGNNLKASITEFQKRAKADGKYNDVADGCVGAKTYQALKAYGFKG